jgi:HD-like signal output (HDOD) protein
MNRSPEIPASASIDAQLLQVTELISLPEFYLKISQLIDDPASDVDDFARVIRLDPNLSTKLLRVVNSAYFGFSGEISSITRAVSMLGIQQLYIMALSISAVTAVSTLDFPQDIIHLKTFWRKSLLTGVVSRQLAQRLKLRPVERFFLLGLLLEIGHLVLYANFPDMARSSIRLADETGMSIDQAEQRVIGCHYGDIGATLLHHWQLPADMQELLSLQPTPGHSTENTKELSILHIAHAYAQHHYGMSAHNSIEMIDPIAWESTGLLPDEVAEHLQVALSTAKELEKVIVN